MQYNVIIKQENLKSDIDGHLEKLGFKNSNGSRSPFPEDNKTLKEYSNVLDYFKNLTSFSVILDRQTFLANSSLVSVSHIVGWYYFRKENLLKHTKMISIFSAMGRISFNDSILSATHNMIE